MDSGLAVRLADEGVPLRAIARATHAPSDLVRETLREALDNGHLLELPKEDWPPGFPRDQRALQLSRMVVEDKEAVLLALQRVFHLTTTEVGLLMLLLTSHTVPKERINMATRTVDVHVYNIRQRLAPFGVVVSTLWGYGYQLSSSSRKKIMKLVVRNVRKAVPT
jgi:DNA-binding response OmpR family regulator